MGLWDLFSSSNEQDAAEAQKRGLRRAERRAVPELRGGMQDLREGYRDAADEYQAYTRAYEPAARSYSDALGLGGQRAQNRATEQFQTSPGYQFQMDQGLEALERSAARRGMLGSGNLSMDEMEYAGGLADQEYDDYLNRLFATSEAGRNTAGSLATIETGLGDREYGYGTDLANLYRGTETGLGQADYNYNLGLDQTGANVFGAGMGLANAALGFGAMPMGTTTTTTGGTTTTTGGRSLGARLLFGDG